MKVLNTSVFFPRIASKHTENRAVKAQGNVIISTAKSKKKRLALIRVKSSLHSVINNPLKLNTSSSSGFLEKSVDTNFINAGRIDSVCCTYADNDFVTSVVIKT